MNRRSRLGCLVVVWLSLPQHSVVRLCFWPFQLHITHPVLLAVFEKPENQTAAIFKVHSDAKLNLRPSVCSCVESLFDGWASDVVERFLCPPGAPWFANGILVGGLL